MKREDKILSLFFFNSSRLCTKLQKLKRLFSNPILCLIFFFCTQFTFIIIPSMTRIGGKIWSSHSSQFFSRVSEKFQKYSQFFYIQFFKKKHTVPNLHFLSKNSILEKSRFLARRIMSCNFGPKIEIF